MPVIDASVWVSFCHGGDRHHGKSSERLRERLMAGESLLAPTLLRVEVAAALRRLTGDAALVRDALAETDRFEWLRFFELTHERSLRAAEIATASGVRGADAVYLELAAQCGEPLLTWDRQQLERGAAVARVETP